MDRFIDVTYSELVSNPLAVLRRIYQHLDLPLSQVAAQRMTQLASNRSRYPKRFVSMMVIDSFLALRGIAVVVLLESRQYIQG